MKKEKDSKNFIQESILELEDMKEFISTVSTNTIKGILDEAVGTGLKNIISEANDYEEEDEDLENEEGLEDVDVDSETELEDENETETEDETEDEEEDSFEDEVEDDVEDTEMDSLEDEEDGEEDFDLSSYETGEGEYDLTNSSIEDVIKVFKKIDDNDSVIVKKLEGDKLEVDDEETGAEYIIDLGDDDEDDFDVDIEESINEDFDGGSDDFMSEEDDDEIEFELELGGDEEGEGLVDEKNMTQSIGTNRRAGRMTQTRQDYAPGKATNRDGAKLIANEMRTLKAEYESKIKLMEAAYNKKIKAINEEVSQYKNALSLFRDKLKENAVLNNNLAKYVKLVTENATTKQEKIEILEKFSKQANTIELGNKLFESINSELKNKTSNLGVELDKQYSINESTGQVKEQVIYQSKDLAETINLIKRMNTL